MGKATGELSKHDLVGGLVRDQRDEDGERARRGQQPRRVRVNQCGFFHMSSRHLGQDTEGERQ